jgi:hypothetical protein
MLSAVQSWNSSQTTGKRGPSASARAMFPA